MEVNGGSEYYTRLIAEKLSKNFDVEVLTTTAIGYDTWENYYNEGIEEINGIKVRRFKVDRPRNVQSFNALTDKIVFNPDRTPEDEKQWIDAQGPVCDSLIDYICVMSRTMTFLSLSHIFII